MARDSSGGRYDYRLRINVAKGSIDHLLLEYLKAQEAQMLGTERESVLVAVRAFWLPLAYQHWLENPEPNRGVTPEDVRRCLLDQVARLQDQIRYLNARIGYDLQVEGLIPSPVIEQPEELDEVEAPLEPLDGYDRDLFED